MPKTIRYARSLSSFLTALIFSGSLVSGSTASLNEYCQLAPDEISRKDSLRQNALKGNFQSQKDYRILIEQNAEQLRNCRSRNWLQEQAIWLRLYACDVRGGSIESVLDRIVAKGYNTVYVEVFADSQVLLPPNDNPTVWDSLINAKGAENVDLLAKTIEEGHRRGLKVYAWLFSLNFGYVYAQKPDRQAVLARNGKGQDSTRFVHDQSQAFVDPYSETARSDYLTLLEAILKRRPDGVLFDYIRYPRGTGTESAVAKVQDLWIYSPASRQAFINRGLNQKGKFVIDRYISRGYFTANDLAEADKTYPDEGSPLWQGRIPPNDEMKLPWQTRLNYLKQELWLLAVAHAAQGVIDYLGYFSAIVQRQGIPAGAVFFPDGNQIVGNAGFDSRLQAWDSFPPSLEWHPMSYAICSDTNCVVNQIQRVVESASGQTTVIPALAGLWGQTYNNRPSLEAQMEAIRMAFPRVSQVSHFAFSWQEPEIDKERRFCKL
jgi:hypothetical protein